MKDRWTRASRNLAASLAIRLLCVAACAPGDNPCNPDTGEIGGWVFYHDGEFKDVEGRVYAQPGDRPFQDCTVINGNISLKGELADFSDFDHIDEIAGFFENGSILEESPTENSECGVIRGFASLRRITSELRDSNGSLTSGTGCYYLDGFESLEYVARNFVCRGPEQLGSELREVTGTLTCPEDRLLKLERVGSIALAGSTLPSLRWAGKVTAFPVESIDLPLLEEVGPYFIPEHPTTNEGALRLNQASIRAISLPSLRRVEGDLEVTRTAGLHEDLYLEGRAEEVREYFAQVEVTGRRIICRNDPTDPCPSDPECGDHYGADSLECCGLPWPTCLELYGGE